jgi:hypothetical protein
VLRSTVPRDTSSPLIETSSSVPQILYDTFIYYNI